MAHFAEIIAGIGARVIVINNADRMVDEERNEAKGAALCNTLLGGTWVQTSYNTHGGVNSDGRIALRFNYAGIGTGASHQQVLSSNIQLGYGFGA